MTAPIDADGPKSSMGIDPYERNWLRFSIALLVSFAIVVAIAGFAMGFTVPGADEEVDPRTVLDSEPWSEPGLREIAPGIYEAYIVAQMWAYTPSRIELPVGSELTIFVTSPDVQHGLKVRDTNINLQVVPGQVSTLSHTFDEVGEFPFICHEYCGIGHAAMFGSITVIPTSGATPDDSESDS